MQKFIQIAVIYISALVPLAYGSIWIYMFGFTDYRHNNAWIGLTLGICCVALAIGMFSLHRLSIQISIFVASLLLVFDVVLFLMTTHYTLILIGFLCSIYLKYTTDYLIDSSQTPSK